MSLSDPLGFFAWNKGLPLGGTPEIPLTQLLQPLVMLVVASISPGNPIGWMEVLFFCGCGCALGAGMAHAGHPLAMTMAGAPWTCRSSVLD